MKTKYIILIALSLIAFFVLTGVWALYTSGEILDAFKIVNEGLKTSNSSLQEREDSLFNAAQNHSGDKEITKRVTEAREESDKYHSFIDSLKNELMGRAGGIDENGDIVKRDDIELAAQLMINEKKGDLLFVRMQLLKNTLKNISSDSIANAKIESLLSLPRSKKIDANHLLFDHVPVTAAVTILSKLQNDAVAASQVAYEGALRQMEINK